MGMHVCRMVQWCDGCWMGAFGSIISLIAAPVLCSLLSARVKEKYD